MLVHLRLHIFLLIGLLTLGQAVAQDETGSPELTNPALSNLLVADYLESKLQLVTNRTGLTEESRANLTQLYQQSIGLRSDLLELDSEQTRILKTTDSASNQLYEANLQLSQPVEDPTLDLPEETTLQALNQKIAEVQATFQQANSEKERLEDEPKRRADRKVEIAGLLTKHRAALNDPTQAHSEQSEDDLSESVGQALDDYELLQTTYHTRKIRNLNLEMASYDATSDLLLAQQALAGRRTTFLTKQLTQLKEALNEKREAESAQAAEDAEQARQRAEALQLPVVTSLAETNQSLAQKRVGISDQLKSTSSHLDEIEQEWKAVRDSYEQVQERVSAAEESGITHNYAIGVALRIEQVSLPSNKGQEADIQARKERMTTAQLESLRIDKMRRAGADIEDQLSAIRSSLRADLTEQEQAQALEECKRLLEEQRSLLASLSRDYGSLVNNLEKLNRVQQQFVDDIEDFRGFISERVLWIQSTDRLSITGFKNEASTIIRVLREELSTGLLPYLKNDWKRNPFIYWSAIGLLVALLVARLRLSRGLSDTCPNQDPEGRLSLEPAGLALLYTVILTIPLPALLLFLSWRVDGYSGTTELADQWAHAFYFIGTGMMVLEFVRQACRRPGLALAHLRWPDHNVRLVRFHFTWVIFVGVPLGIVTDLLEGVFVEGVSNRLFFIASQILLALLGHWILRSPQGLRFNTHDGERSVEGPMRFQRFYHFLAIAIPILFVITATLGYAYTARHIWIRVSDSIQWGMVVLLITLLMLHWLTVLRRRLAVKKVELRKELGDDEKALEQTGSDIWQVYSASRRLFTSMLWIIMVIGLYVIWVDMIPALKVLDQTPIPFLGGGGGSEGGGSYQIQVPGVDFPTAPQDESAHATAITTDQSPLIQKDFLSVADLIRAALVLMITLAASRNLPGFVEMLLLSRMKFQQGEGYAIVTILRYTILLVGIGWTLTLLGLTWNKVQWLAAAATVGIGFGLQEIFANFVSGLILLFERPVRVGDVITVGKLTGTVTRIQMRATTVRDWDQQELILPNKDLVTGQVINWTLSNDVSRLSITVGVSYDADVKRASQLLLAIAKETPNVKSDPAPFVTFDEFGDSTLNLVLRVYVSIEVRLGTKNWINNAILERFREADIEIAYPQRDLHLRSVSPEAQNALPGTTQKSPPSAAPK